MSRFYLHITIQIITFFYTVPGLNSVLPGLNPLNPLGNPLPGGVLPNSMFGGSSNVI